MGARWGTDNMALAVKENKVMAPGEGTSRPLAPCVCQTPWGSVTNRLVTTSHFSGFRTKTQAQVQSWKVIHVLGQSSKSCSPGPHVKVLAFGKGWQVLARYLSNPRTTSTRTFWELLCLWTYTLLIYSGRLVSINGTEPSRTLPPAWRGSVDFLPSGLGRTSWHFPLRECGRNDTTEQPQQGHSRCSFHGLSGCMNPSYHAWESPGHKEGT